MIFSINLAIARQSPARKTAPFESFQTGISGRPLITQAIIRLVSPTEESEMTQSSVASRSHSHQKLERWEVVLLELSVQGYCGKLGT